MIKISAKKHTACKVLYMSLAKLLLVLVAFGGLTGCVEREDPLLLLSADEALTQGKSFLDQEKYFKARRHLIHAFEVEPNSRTGREALLLAADALYLQGGTDNFIKCEAKYRDFLNRFPTSDKADYAQYKIAACLAARSERPDRDQKMTHAAIDALEELLRLYPTSDYVTEARQQMRELTDQLAGHELVVGKFYNRYGGVGICPAAIARFEYLQENYPQFAGMDEVLVELALAYERCLRPGDAAEAIEDLRRRFPESEYLAEAAKIEEKAAAARLSQIEKAAEQAIAEAKAKGNDEDSQDSSSDGTDQD